MAVLAAALLMIAGVLVWRGTVGGDVQLWGQRYTDPRMESVWLGGEAALRHHINQPNYDDFSESSVVVSAGDLTSFCGRFGIPEQDGVFVKRFVALEGRRETALMEYQTPSFDVLWNRLCPTETAANTSQPAPPE